MREIDHPPDAASLMESMRSIGYSLDSALADLLDNSISANAKTVQIEFRPFEEPYVAILDDGDGMSEVELESAMRHGSQSPLSIRKETDLGRYGLGLKTASLSQCRCLTVVSKHNGKISARRWDLDVIAKREAWKLLALDEAEIHSLPHVCQLESGKSGTIVLWQKLDRLMAGESNIEKALGQKMDEAREHLSLVFHRYITGEPGLKKLAISINNNPLAAIDPFLLDHRATQRLEEESFKVEGSRVIVKPFILPHISKLSTEDMARAGGREGLRSQQGFYIYRKSRLIIWGTWFRLARKEELNKLARVRVDIPNALDHLWTLDIKKSAAHPPEAVRVNLRRTVDRITESSGRTIVYRGRTTNANHITPGWREIKDRGGVRYEINRDHPAVKAIADELEGTNHAAFEAMLKVLESSFPADALYANMASEMRPIFNSDSIVAKLRGMIEDISQVMSHSPDARRSLLENIHVIEPFNAHPDIARTIAMELLNDERE